MARIHPLSFDFNRIPVFFQGVDSYCFVRGIKEKAGPFSTLLSKSYSNPIIFIVVAAPEAALKEYRNPGMVL